jgi:RNA-directed DNA polymerase
MDPLPRPKDTMNGSPMTLDELAAHLGTTSSQLLSLVDRLPLGTDYRILSIHVGHRHRRLILPLVLYDSIVKRLRQILMLTSHYAPPPNVSGFIKGRSTRSNASQHLAQACVLRLDVHRFFDSITSGRVHEALIADGYNADVAELVTRLATPEGFLATGLSTSPHLSNLVFQETDSSLLQAAEAMHLTYTRYVDDLIFSGNVTDAHAAELRQILANHGWRINEHKTAFMRRGHRQYVTGLSVNDSRRPHAPRSLKRAMRWRLHMIERVGYAKYMEEFSGATNGDFPKVLLGLARYVAGLEPSLGEAWIDRWEAALPDHWEQDEDFIDEDDFGDYMDFVRDGWS